MVLTPGFEIFRETYEAGRPQVVSTKLIADLETPVSAYLKLSKGRAPAFLLESVEGGAVRGRYSIIGLPVRRVVTFHGHHLEIRDQGQLVEARDRKSTRLNSSHTVLSRMPSSA